MSKVARKASRRGPNLTTEQLAQKAVKDIQQMSEQEKAKVREHLSKALKPAAKLVLRDP
jgi:hypothetical protein